MIYPLPNKVKTVPTTTLGEVVRTRAPAVLAEVAYHDNPEDAEWIRNNIDKMAQNLVLSLADYFDIPFNFPSETLPTVYVKTMSGSNLNIRYNPSIEAPVIGSVPNGAEVTVFAQIPDWSVIEYNGTVGYARTSYLRY